MPPYSREMRRDVLAACDAGGGTRAVALRFGVSESWVRRVKQERRETGKLAPSATRDRTPTWHAWSDWLEDTLAAEPDLYVRELKARLKDERGVEAGETLVGRACRLLKLTRKKKRSSRPSSSARTSPRRG